MLATASLGAVWSSTSPDFGVSVSRFGIIFLSSLCIYKTQERERKSLYKVIFDFFIMQQKL